MKTKQIISLLAGITFVALSRATWAAGHGGGGGGGFHGGGGFDAGGFHGGVGRGGGVRFGAPRFKSGVTRSVVRGARFAGRPGSIARNRSAMPLELKIQNERNLIT